MAKRKEPLFVSSKKYNELMEKCNALENSLSDELEKNQSIKNMYAVLIEQQGQIMSDIKGMTVNYDNLVEQQLSVLRYILTDETAEELYDLVSPIDYNGRCLWRTCYEILGTEPSSTFNAEENMGWFENMSYHNLVKWNEIGQFHNIRWKQSGAYEFYDSSTFDETRRDEYDAYRTKLYIGTIDKIISEFSKIHKCFRQEQEKAVADSEFYSNINSICRRIPTINAMSRFMSLGENNNDFEGENTAAEDEEIEI